MYKLCIFMPFSTIFTTLFYPFIAHERTAKNLIRQFAHCASLFLLSAIAPKIKVRSRAKSDFKERCAQLWKLVTERFYHLQKSGGHCVMVVLSKRLQRLVDKPWVDETTMNQKIQNGIMFCKDSSECRRFSDTKLSVLAWAPASSPSTNTPLPSAS